MRLPAPTARLVFRAWTADDLPLARALWGDPRVTALVGGPFDDEQVRKKLLGELACAEAHGFQYWPVFLRETGAHVGCCGLKPGPEPDVPETGYYLRPEHWGGGLAVEALRAVVAHAFQALGARALVAGHHPENHPSARVLAKLGFRYTHHERYPPTGLDHPNYRLERA